LQLTFVCIDELLYCLILFNELRQHINIILNHIYSYFASTTSCIFGVNLFSRFEFLQKINRTYVNVTNFTIKRTWS